MNKIGTNGLEIKVSDEESEKLLAALDSAHLKILQSLGGSTGAMTGADLNYKIAYMKCVRAGLKEKPKRKYWPETTMTASATWKEGKQPPKKKDGRGAWRRNRMSLYEIENGKATKEKRGAKGK